MTEKEFGQNYLPKIKEIFNFALTSNFSNFYIIKYKDLTPHNLKIENYEQFKKIPALTKDEILDVELCERTFIEESQINRFNLSTGTTNHNKIMAIPLGISEAPGKLNYSINSISVKGKRCLIMFPPMSAAFSAHIRSINGAGGIFIPGDIGNLKRTALVTKELEPEIIITTPTILEFFLKELDEINYNVNLIKEISLGGENTSRLKLDYFKARFTNANIVFRYGSSETGGLRGYRCQYLAAESPDLYHPGEVFIEIMDESGKSLADGELGEIVHTDLISPKGFPFIRYKTGDIGSTYYKECPCGNNRVIKLGGRANYDVLKFSGITLYTEQIEKSLTDFSNEIIPTFEMHVYEEVHNDKITPKLILKISLKTDAGKITEKIIQNMVTEKLFLSANKNLKYFVDNGIFLPLEVLFVEKSELSSIKRTGIISHL